jgi:hypothetical protein
LLLHSDDEADPITDNDIKAVIAAEEIRTLFPNGYYVLPGEAENTIVVTASTAYTVLPDKATLETPGLRIVYDDQPMQEINLRAQYNSCTSLIKAVGCQHCDDKGIVCLRRGLQSDVMLQNFDKRSDDDDAKEMFKNRKTKIGPFTYISPRLTIPDRHFFVPSFRHYDDHDFSMIETNSQTIGTNNKERAEYLRFKKNSCGVCPLRGSCHAYRSCVGHYPSEAEIAKQLLEEGLPLVENSAGFAPWQFWAVARCGGARAKYKRYEITIHGMERAYFAGRTGQRAVIFRTKTDVGRVTEVDNYDELKRLFSGLPDEETAKKYPEIWGRPENDVTAALYLRLMEFSETSRLHGSGGWGGKTSYGILAKRLQDRDVRVTYCNPRYERHSTEIKTFRQFFDEISHRLGVPQARVRDRLHHYAND